MSILIFFWQRFRVYLPCSFETESHSPSEIHVPASRSAKKGPGAGMGHPHPVIASKLNWSNAANHVATFCKAAECLWVVVIPGILFLTVINYHRRGETSQDRTTETSEDYQRSPSCEFLPSFSGVLYVPQTPQLIFCVLETESRVRV